MLKTVAAALLAASAIAGAAQADDRRRSLKDVAFLEGAWRGGEDLVFEEIWSAPAAGVMTGMARGRQNGVLRVLEYIIVSETEDGVEMRFKHFSADYSTWEADGPIILRLTKAAENDVTFSADPPSETVNSIRYWMPSDNELRADAVLVEDGEEGGFSLTFRKAD